jgi:hypothetical protein
MSTPRTIDELARHAAAVTRDTTVRRPVLSLEVEEFAARLRPRRALRVAAVAVAIGVGIVTLGTLANELRDGRAVPVITDVDDPVIVEDAAPPAVVIRDGAWEWDWALSLVTDREAFGGAGQARVSGIAMPSEDLAVAVGVSPTLSSTGQARPGVWVSRDAGSAWRVAPQEAIELPAVADPDVGVVMHDVAASGGRLVAVGTALGATGEHGVVWVSDDAGATWSVVHHTEEAATHRMVAIVTTSNRGWEASGATAGRARFVAVGSHAGPTGPSTAAVWVSQGGTDWSDPALLPGAAPGPTATSLAVDPRTRRLVAVGGHASGDDRATGGESRAWVSVDHGRSWRVEPIGEDIDLTSVTHGAEGWMAVGTTRASAADGSDRDGVVVTSLDGSDWQRAEDPLGALAGPGTQALHAATWGEGLDPYVAVGLDDDRPAMWVSPDMETWRRLPSEELFPAGTRTGITAAAYWGGIIAIGELPRPGGTELAVWRTVGKDPASAPAAELSDDPPPIELADDVMWTSPPGLSRDEAVRAFAAAAFGWDDPEVGAGDGGGGDGSVVRLMGPEGTSVELGFGPREGGEPWWIGQLGDSSFSVGGGVLTLASGAPVGAVAGDLYVREGARTWHLELRGEGALRGDVDLVRSGLPTGSIRSVLVVYRDEVGAVVGAAGGHF